MKFAQIEKESIAIVLGCAHFHIYIYGRPFELETDHRPLEHIYKQPRQAAARIERWKLRLQEYDFKVVYRLGGKNLADCLSRLPTPAPRSNMEACTNHYVQYLVDCEQSLFTLLWSCTERGSVGRAENGTRGKTGEGQMSSFWQQFPEAKTYHI